MLMEEYKKDFNRNYLVFSEIEEQELEPDGLRMLLQNDIKGVLRLERRSIDNKSQYYYDVTGLKKLSELCRVQKLGKKELDSLLLGIADILERGTVYFLEADGFLLKPEYIYVKNSVLRNMGENRIRLRISDLRLCYYPGKGEDAGGQLNHLLEYLLNQVDYKDEEAVAQVYDLYQRSCDEGFFPFRLHELIKAEREFPTREEWKEEKQRETTGEDNRDIYKQKNEKEKTYKEKIYKEKGQKENGHRANGKERIKGNKKGNSSEGDKRNGAGEKSLPEKKNEAEKVFLAAGMLILLVLFGGLYWRGVFLSPFTGEIRWIKLAGSGCVVLLLEAFLGYRLYGLIGKEGGKSKYQSSTEGKKEDRDVMLDDYGRQMEKIRMRTGSYGKQQKNMEMPVDCYGLGADDMSKDFNLPQSRREEMRMEGYSMPQTERAGMQMTGSMPQTGKAGVRMEGCFMPQTERAGMQMTGSMLQTGKAGVRMEGYSMPQTERAGMWTDASGQQPGVGKTKEGLNIQSCCLGEESAPSFPQPGNWEKEDIQEAEEEKTQLLADMEKTMLLCAESKKQKSFYYLQPIGEEDADRIPVMEFPFFWGKIPMRGRKRIENRAISRFHAKFEKEGEDIFLTDLNSTNGTFVNHVRLEANQPVLLKPGDEVMFADTVYQFTLAQ